MSSAIQTHIYHQVPADAGAPASAPVILLLHGTGGDEHDLVPLAQQLVPGAPILSPRGNVSEHGAARFFRRHAEGVFDLDDARFRTGALAGWVRAAVAHHKLGSRPLVALGFSNGANIAALLMQLQPSLLDAAILLRPMVVIDEPAAAGTLAGKRVLIASGAHDPIVPPDHPARLAALLRAGGADVTLHTADDAGHNLVRSDIEAMRRFLSQAARTAPRVTISDSK